MRKKGGEAKQSTIRCNSPILLYPTIQNWRRPMCGCASHIGLLISCFCSAKTTTRQQLKKLQLLTSELKRDSRVDAQKKKIIIHAKKDEKALTTVPGDIKKNVIESFLIKLLANTCCDRKCATGT